MSSSSQALSDVPVDAEVRNLTAVSAVPIEPPPYDIEALTPQQGNVDVTSVLQLQAPCLKPFRPDQAAAVNSSVHAIGASLNFSCSVHGEMLSLVFGTCCYC